jgi:hypothetical protein
MQWGDLKDLFPGNMHDKSRELRHFITGECYKLPGFPLSIAPPPTPTSSLLRNSRCDVATPSRCLSDVSTSDDRQT